MRSPKKAFSSFVVLISAIVLPTILCLGETTEKDIEIRYKPIFTTEAGNDWWQTDYDDSAWDKITLDCGLDFWMLGPLNEYEATTELEQKILRAKTVQSQTGFLAKGRAVYWQPHYAVQTEQHTTTQDIPSNTYIDRREGDIFYILTRCSLTNTMSAAIQPADFSPQTLWINGVQTSYDQHLFELTSGDNTILIKSKKGPPKNLKIISTKDKTDIFLDCCQNCPIGLYRLKFSPNGTQKLLISAVHKSGTPVKIWINGQEQTEKSTDTEQYELPLETSQTNTAIVAILLEHRAGIYAGKALKSLKWR